MVRKYTDDEISAYISSSNFENIFVGIVKFMEQELVGAGYGSKRDMLDHISNLRSIVEYCKKRIAIFEHNRELLKEMFVEAYTTAFYKDSFDSYRGQINFATDVVLKIL